MRLNPTHETHKVHHGLSADESREVLIVTILLALFFVIAAVIVVVTRAQNPNCVDLKRRLDDASRAYQTVLLQSQMADKNVLSYQATVTKLKTDLIANDKKREQAEKDLVAARSDRTRCERNPDILAHGGCANVTQRIESAEKIITYARANQKKLATDLAESQQQLASVKANLSAANGYLTSAQQDLDIASHAYSSAGCAHDKR